MPGRLMMDVQSSKVHTNLGKEGDHAPKAAHGKGQDAPMGNTGQDHLKMNGSLENGTSHVGGSNNALPNGFAPTTAKPGSNHIPEGNEDAGRSPPELEHYTDSYVPFGTLLERMGQQAYHDLHETIEGMADMVVPPSASVNGVAGSSAPDTNPTSVDKKRKLMEYAETQKSRFIKALVLSDWAKNMDDMDKVIELAMWLRRQDELTSAAADGILNLKRNMVAAKMPNPNIEGALELLSTGKAPWVPDLGYIPPKPLTSAKLLQTLKDMNFMLSVRLNLHEDLPLHFRDYTISNGRATFTVSGEFEVDLAAADEDPDTPFYFIDIRLLFSPGSSFSDDRLRNELEHKVNDALALRGLQGCYDFLHGFVLTHKLNVLRCQAIEMARDTWSGCVDVQLVHRSLIIQYWTGQAGGKNWLELGISSGNKASPHGGKSVKTSEISYRWFRRGREILDHGLHFDLSDLSMERMLNAVIARHASGRLNAVCEQMDQLALGSVSFTQDLQESDSEPTSCVLRMRLEPSMKPMSIAIQPVTGRMVISPPTQSSRDAERQINNDPGLDIGHMIRYLHCKALQDIVLDQAQNLGCVRVRTERQAALHTVFGKEPIRFAVFRRDDWGPDWALATTVDMSGIGWWVVQLRQSENAMMQSISAAEPLPTTQFIGKAVDRRLLLAIEKLAVSKISTSSAAEELRAQEIPFSLQQHTTPERNSHQQASDPSRLYIQADDLLPDTKTSNATSRAGFWCSGLLKLSLHGLGPVGKTVHILKAAWSTDPIYEILPQLLCSGQGDSDILFKPDNAVEIFLRTPLGGPILPIARSKLQRIQRLCEYVCIARRYKFRITSAEPRRLAFCYASYAGNPRFLAELTFPEEKVRDTTTEVRLFAESSGTQSVPANPHIHIQESLRRQLNTKPTSADQNQSSGGFESFCRQLVFTLPLLKSLIQIQNADPYLRASFQHNTTTSYRLSYSSPLPDHAFFIKAKCKDNSVFWEVLDGRYPEASEQLRKQLRDEIWNSNGEGWKGLALGACATIQGVQELLSKIDGLMRSFKDMEQAVEDKTKDEGEADKDGSKGREIVVLD